MPETFKLGKNHFSADQITSDSRKVKPGDLFFALPGILRSGCDFINDAVKRGAKSVICSKEDENKACSNLENLDEKFSFLAVENIHAVFVEALKRTLAIKCHPTFAVTGTNGKTTITYLIKHLMDLPTAVIGTLQYDLIDKKIPSRQTTPDTEMLYRMIARLPTDAALAIELSSHALDQRRAYGLAIDAAIFSNLTSDHLDYHKTQEAYFLAKRRLFLGDNGYVPKKNIIRKNDPFGERLLQEFCGVSYGVCCPGADYNAHKVQFSLQGTHFQFEHEGEFFDIKMPLIGIFNVENVLAALAAVHEVRKIPLEILCEKIARFQGVPGRLERIPNNRGLTIIIDFAHTEDGLRVVLSSLRQIAKGRILTVFGCGGDRDRTKRPKMMAVACEFSDHVFATSDNSRHESIEVIFHDMDVGRPEHYPVIYEPDRAAAIAQALEQAQPGDTVLIAGKGHEQYQQIGDEKLPFSDKACVMEWLKEH